MEKFYSIVNSNILLHFVIRKEDFIEGRKDLIHPDNFLQCSTLNLNAGTTFKPHKHNVRNRTWDIISQESWHVISGSVKCLFFDINNKLIAEPILKAGDTSFTLYGGHTYLILEDGTRVLEYKTGKYEGHEIDKTIIGWQ